MDRYFLYMKNVFDKHFYSLVETFYKDFDRIIDTYYFSGYKILRYPISDKAIEVYAKNDKAQKLIGMILLDCEDDSEDESLQNGGDVDLPHTTNMR